MRFFTTFPILLLLISFVGCNGSPTQPIQYEDSFSFISVTPVTGSSLRIGDVINLTYSASYKRKYASEEKSHAIILSREDGHVYILEAWGSTGGYETKNQKKSFTVTRSLYGFLKEAPVRDMKYVTVRQLCCVYVRGQILSELFWNRVLLQFSYEVNYSAQ